MSVVCVVCHREVRPERVRRSHIPIRSRAASPCFFKTPCRDTHEYSLRPPHRPTIAAAVLSPPPPVSACTPVLCPIPPCDGGGGIAGPGSAVGAANARRRVWTIPGPSVSMMHLPGILSGAAVHEVE